MNHLVLKVLFVDSNPISAPSWVSDLGQSTPVYLGFLICKNKDNNSIQNGR